jgi:hypothetical protein
MFRTRIRRILLVVWALALSTALSFSVAQATAVHASCQTVCEQNCGGSGCKRSYDMGCTCIWRCNNGSNGVAVCAL